MERRLRVRRAFDCGAGKCGVDDCTGRRDGAHGTHGIGCEQWSLVVRDDRCSVHVEIYTPFYSGHRDARETEGVFYSEAAAYAFAKTASEWAGAVCVLALASAPEWWQDEVEMGSGTKEWWAEHGWLDPDGRLWPGADDQHPVLVDVSPNRIPDRVWHALERRFHAWALRSWAHRIDDPATKEGRQFMAAVEAMRIGTARFKEVDGE